MEVKQNYEIKEYDAVDYVPNAETIAAILETEELLKNPYAKTYSSLEEIIEEIRAEIEEENARNGA